MRPASSGTQEKFGRRAATSGCCAVPPRTPGLPVPAVPQAVGLVCQSASEAVTAGEKLKQSSGISATARVISHAVRYGESSNDAWGVGLRSYWACDLLNILGAQMALGSG